jgi:hypothetical protein
MKQFVYIILLVISFISASTVISFSETRAFAGIRPVTDSNDLLKNMNAAKKLITLPSNHIETKTSEHFKYAIMLNLPVELIENLDLFRFIGEWHGTRYLFGGTTKKGIDCSAFTQRLINDVYCKKMHRVVAPQYSQCKPVSKDEMKQGDLVFFETFMPGLSHVGLYLGNNKFVHAASSKGVCIDDLNNTYYKKAYRKSGRFLE